MKARHWFALGGAALGATGLALAISSFLPRRFETYRWPEIEAGDIPAATGAAWPEVEVEFLRCGSITIPEPIAVRGSFSLAPCTIAHSAVLVRHPRATFLFDTGLCSDIFAFLEGQSLFFRKTLANFSFTQSLCSHLVQRQLEPDDLDFALLSHLHWDHVSGIPDLPDIPLRVNRVEYDAARAAMLDANGGLVRRLMGKNAIALFDLDGPPYEGFRASYDLFGDGSVVLVPLPGHTAGSTGMFISRANGPRIFLLGDAAWVSQNYLRPATMHSFIWSRVTSDDATARQTLIDLHHFAHRHPEVVMLAMHDAAAQDQFMANERENAPTIELR